MEHGLGLAARVKRGGRRRLRYGAWKSSQLARRGARRATGPLRVHPTFLVAGEMKCGTSSLYDYLLRHPSVLGSPVKEPHYFDFYFHRGPEWYRTFFPARAAVERARRREGAEPAVGEASPYFFYPGAPQRVFETDPALRLVFILRDPVDRAYSHYWDKVSFTKESLPFEEALEREPERLRGEAERTLADPRYVSEPYFRFSYQARGRYADHLARWLELFPREQVFVLGLEELLAAPERLVPELCRFLGVPVRDLGPFPALNRKQYPPMAPATRARLEALFAEPNRRLYELLGRDLGWSRPATRDRPPSAPRRPRPARRP